MMDVNVCVWGMSCYRSLCKGRACRAVLAICFAFFIDKDHAALFFLGSWCNFIE